MGQIRYQVSDFKCDSTADIAKYAVVYDSNGNIIAEPEITFLEDVEDLREPTDKRV